jgi:hypothetical protein
MITLIGLTGKKGSGKDLAASTGYGYCGVHRLSFAEPLKYGCMDMFGLSEFQVFGAGKEVIDPRYNKTPRQILQWLGSDVIRDQFDKEHWTSLTENKIKAIMEDSRKLPASSNDTTIIFVTDVRFDNEAEMIRKLGGHVIEILRPGKDGGADSHVSEQGVSDALIDIKIDNTTDDPVDLFDKIENALISIMEKK